MGEVKPHYYTMASQLRRSADQLLDGEGGSNGGPRVVPASANRARHTPQASSSSASSSSNEMNISSPEVENGPMDRGEESWGRGGEVNKESNIANGSSGSDGGKEEKYSRLRVNNNNLDDTTGKLAYTKFDDDFNVTATSSLDDSDIGHSTMPEVHTLSRPHDYWLCGETYIIG